MKPIFGTLSERLKPCPFCGAGGSSLTMEEENHFNPEMFFIRCYPCQAEGPLGNDSENAINLWNNRI